MPPKVVITKEELKKPDKFREAVLKAIVFGQEHSSKILLGFGGAFLLLIGAFVFVGSSVEGDIEANARFNEALAVYGGENPGDALAKFVALKEEYPKTPVSNLALYYAADISYSEGKYTDAISFINQFLGGGVTDETLSGAANLLLGLSFFNQGKWQEALDSLSKLEAASTPYASQAKLHMGLALEKLGRTEEADKIYREILNPNAAQPKLEF
ncbi:MAG: tetratricopeptide repeat protein [Deltaproteobacteria bacterium]